MKEFFVWISKATRSCAKSRGSGGSHVLEGIHADTSRPNVRFSFSRNNTKDEIDFAVGIIKEAFEKELVD